MAGLLARARIVGGALVALLAGEARAAEHVDVQLILAVDVSLSMSPQELEIQRRGYAAALTHDDVIQAIADGAHGKIAVAYVEWAGETMQKVVVPWTVIASRTDAQRFASELSARPPGSARRTSISGALAFSGELFAESDLEATKRVIDVSGDGTNNQGGPVTEIRDRLVGQGIVINGLPLMTHGGLASEQEPTDLDRYYADCVIGGPGSFMVPVTDWMQFPQAVRRKLVQELAGMDFSPHAEKVAAPRSAILAAGDGSLTDCLVGEKTWHRNWTGGRF